MNQLLILTDTSGDKQHNLNILKKANIPVYNSGISSREANFAKENVNTMGQKITGN